MVPGSNLLLRRLRDRLMPTIRRTAEDVVLEVIERKGIPSRTEYRQTIAEVEEKARVLESVRGEIEAMIQRRTTPRHGTD